MNTIDGPEQRMAWADELARREEDAEVVEISIAEQFAATVHALHEARARLADIAMGADMMLQPVMNAQGWVKAYIEEVRRVARAPL